MDLVESTVKAIERIFNAKSVAVVGASNDPSKFGYMTLDSLIRGGYEGRIYPVNPKGHEFFGLKAYPSTSEVPAPLDLVIIVVPAKYVAGILREAAAKEAAGVIICSGGFREAGRLDLEKAIEELARELKLRLLGPNISGIAYLPNKMCVQFFPVLTKKGPLAVISQSGTITNGLCEWASDEGLGISAGINLGNQVDLCESDYLEFFARDDNTKAIALYLEGVKDGRRFLEVLRRTTRQKPVAILKGGRTAAGQRSIASHTASMASNHRVFSSACRQCGAFVAKDIESLYDAAKALALMPPPQGNRVLCISTSGGANTLAMDVVDDWGLEIPAVPVAMVQELEQLELSPLADFSNPVDLVSLNAEDFKKVALLADKYDLADVVMINFGDPVQGDLELVQFLEMNIKANLVVSYFAGGDLEKKGRIKIQENGYPVYPAPERAIKGIAAKLWETRYRQVRGSEKGGRGRIKDKANKGERG